MAKQAWQHDRRSRHERGYDAAYMRARAVVMQVNRQGKSAALCRVCLTATGRVSLAVECDHIVPKARADANGMIRDARGVVMHMNDPRNLQPICVDCHKAKTIAEREGDRPPGKRMRRTDGWKA